MSSSNQAAVVFTVESIEHICLDGGTQSWRMHLSHLGKFDYIICARNHRREDVRAPAEHGSAFLIGKVRDIVPSIMRCDGRKPRFLIRMSEAAIISNRPGFWQWGRWPVHYGSLDALGIAPAEYRFKQLPDLLAEVRQPYGRLKSLGNELSPISAPSRDSWKASIDRAKASLAAELGIEVESVSIVIRK